MGRPDNRADHTGPERTAENTGDQGGTRGRILRWEVGTMAVAMPLRTHRIVLERDPGWPGWAVSVPTLPGCFTQGKTQAQAIERVRRLSRCILPAWRPTVNPSPRRT